MPLVIDGPGGQGEGQNGDVFGGFSDLEISQSTYYNSQQPTQTPQYQRYAQGSGASVSASSAGVDFSSSSIRIGFDQFGNPIYQVQPAPALREYFDLNPGWNTRATIQEPIGPTMYLSYEAGNAVGAIVGLTAVPNAQAGYEDIILGWVTLNGVSHIIARGQILLSVPSSSVAPAPGSYNREVDSLVIVKTLGKVEFFLKSAAGQGGEVRIAEAFMNEPLTFVSAALYLGGDVINNEVLEYPDVLAGQFPLLIGGFYESVTESYIAGEFPMLSGYFYESNSSQLGGTLPALRGLFADGEVSFFGGSLPAIGGDFFSSGEDSITPEFNYTFAYLPALFGAFVGVDTTFGTLEGSLPSMGGFFSDSAEAILMGQLPALRGGFIEDIFPGRLTLVSHAYSRSPMLSRDTTYLVLNSRAEVVAAFTLDEITYMLLESEATENSTATLAEIIYQALMSTMSAGDVASLQRDGMSVWALHMDAGGSTRYEGYDFNSFMTIDGMTYGVNATGIHRLEGATDDGARIPASVDFGRLSFGTNNRKALPYVYVGMSSSGRTVLKVESDDRTYYYTARDSTELMKAHRFEPGRGLRSTFYGLSLQTDGEAFDLHNIDFQQVELKRSL